MARQAIDSWEQQRRRELVEFSNGWDWGRVYWAWSRRLKDFNVALDPLFLTT